MMLIIRYNSHFSQQQQQQLLQQQQQQLLQQQLLNLLLNCLNLWLDLRALILGHTGSNDWPADTTCSAQSLLGPDEDIWHILILTEQRNVKQNLQRLTVSGQDHKLRLTSIEGLGCLIGSLPELLVVGGLLYKVQNLGSQSLVSQRVGFRVDFFRHSDWLVGCKLVL